MSNLGSLTLDLVAEVGRFTSGLNEASRNADRNSREIQRSIQGIDDKLNAVGSNIKKFAAVLGVGLSANAFTGWIHGAAQAAANTAIFASRIDVAVEDLTAMRFVAEQTGVSVESFDASMMRLTRRLGAAKNGTGPAIATLDRLGLSAKALLDLPLHERIKAIGESMKKLETQAERLTAAQDLAGDSARQLVPLFMMQSEEIDRARENAEKLGYVYSTEFAQSADSILTQMGNLKQAFSNVAFSILEDLLPPLEKFINSISADDIQNALNGIKKGFDIAVTSAKGLALVLLGRLVAALYASAASFVASTREALRYQATLASMAGISKSTAVGLTAMGAAARSASLAMNALGGPVGILAIAASSLMMFGTSASKAVTNIEELDAKIYGLSQNIKTLTENQAIRSKNSFNDDIRELEKELKELEEELSRADDAIVTLSTRLATENLSTKHYEAIYQKLQEWERKQQDVKGEIDDTTGAINKASEAIAILDGHLSSLANSATTSTSNIIDRFEEMRSKIEDEIGRIGLSSNVAVFDYELINTDKYKDFTEKQVKELRALYAEKDLALENHKASLKTNKSKSKGVDIAKEYQRIMNSTLSDEERRGQELQKNLDILRQYGATEEEMLAVRRAAYESMSVDLPGFDGTGSTLTAQLARINENISELDKWREEQLQKIQQAYGEEESALAESIARKEEIERQYRERRAQYEGEMSQELLNIGQNLSAESLSALEAAGMEASGIYKAMFLANKAAAFANAIISAQEAGAKALAVMPGPAGIALSKMITGIGLANAGIIAATGLKGMAHSGIDKVPETGTWLLEKGERVVTANTSARLDAVLENISRQRENGSFGNQTPQVNSSVSVVITNEGTVEQRQDDTGGNEIARVIEGKVVEVIVKELRPGGILAKRG